MNPRAAVTHLTPELWARANRLLVRKALAEFAHERLITPAPAGGEYVVHGDDDTVTYHFTACRRELDHWQVDPDSIRRTRNGRVVPLDAVDLCLELRRSLGLDDRILAVYLEEVTATLAGLADRLRRSRSSADDLVDADFQTVEAAMTEGHPCFVANGGRLGFGVDDHHRYAPEAAAEVRLVWLAAHRDHTTFSAAADLDRDTLLNAELDEATRARFAATLAALGLDLADHHLIPVHPWQWWNKLSVTFAGELAARRLVCLGEGPDAYRAQQSVRTFFNVSAPHRHYVKTALSVLNMGFMRGLSAAYMAATPAINDWVAGLIAGDEVFARTGVSILRERAAVGYRHRQYEAATDRHSPYRKMLAALWRESPVGALEPGRRLATMACLLHIDATGRPLAAALFARSGRAPAVWLRGYLDAYLVPLLHAFYAHGLVFLPHGENVLLVLRDGAVERVVLKDIAEEIAVLDPDVPLPPAVERIRVDVPTELRLLSIFTDVFDGFLRHLAALLAGAGVLDEETFWRTVAGCAADYRAAVPHLADRFRRYDLFAPRFARSCLNRLQLRDNQQMVDLADPAGALQLVGELTNPIARYAPAAHPSTGPTGSRECPNDR
ncbi:IucA/IucC family siderophore biosynthesis protein [Micromonospora sp. R77]|uniref:IucA/IucC family protein n=1 Tax=Micromonospora sp. R77 TaxID=2925836 RepID=UPI001F60D87F|nr:IucA/IucC family siderophore biosynthesis protein [Micromonospora sp. R77]MCI4066695.1 IucA/IucC family siderophore biosynthesis protein [Micromonospora sp. R77]